MGHSPRRAFTSSQGTVPSRSISASAARARWISRRSSRAFLLAVLDARRARILSMGLVVGSPFFEPSFAAFLGVEDIPSDLLAASFRSMSEVTLSVHGGAIRRMPPQAVTAGWHTVRARQSACRWCRNAEPCAHAKESESGKGAYRRRQDTPGCAVDRVQLAQVHDRFGKVDHISLGQDYRGSRCLVHASFWLRDNPWGIRKSRRHPLRENRSPGSRQRNGARCGDLSGQGRFIGETPSLEPVQSCQRLLGQRSLIGFRGLPQVLIQLLRHVLQEEIGHGTTLCAAEFVDSASSLILSGRASPLKRNDARPFAPRTARQLSRHRDR